MTSPAIAIPDNVDALKQMVLELHDALHRKDRRIETLEHQLQQLLKARYGPRADRLDPQQLVLFATDLIEEATQPEEPRPSDDGKPRRAAGKGHGRRPLPKDLPRKQLVHDLTDDQKRCPCCGEMRERIGEEVSEQLELIPAVLYVIEHVRRTYACKKCQGQVVTADKPTQPIEKGLAGPGLLAQVITSKYGDHRVQGKAVSEMREGLSWSGDRTRPQTSPNCDGQEPSWEASGANGATRLRQVRSAKSNASEPLMTCRKRIQTTSKLGSGGCPRISMRGSLYPAHVASGAKTARAQTRLGHGTLEPVASMPREKFKRTTRENQSTDARHRGGTTRSSDEGCVMHPERRGRVIQSSDNRSTALAGGAHG